MLGKGAFGEVYLVVDSATNEKVSGSFPLLPAPLLYLLPHKTTQYPHYQQHLTTTQHPNTILYSHQHTQSTVQYAMKSIGRPGNSYADKDSAGSLGTWELCLFPPFFSFLLLHLLPSLSFLFLPFLPFLSFLSILALELLPSSCIPTYPSRRVCSGRQP